MSKLKVETFATYEFRQDEVLAALNLRLDPDDEVISLDSQGAKVTIRLRRVQSFPSACQGLNATDPDCTKVDVYASDKRNGII